MTLPSVQSIVLPLLELAGDGETWRRSDAVEVRAERFELTEADRQIMSGRLTRFYRRVGGH